MNRSGHGARAALLDFAAITAFVALGLAAYANSFHVPFLYDDRVFAENPTLRDLSVFLSLEHPANPSRWVGYLTFALNYRLGGPDVVGFHVVNLCIHLACAALVFALVRVTFRTPRLERSDLAGFSRAVALAAAALFVAHPLQTEAVTYTVQRFTSLATLLYLLAVVLYARWRLMPEAAGRRRLSSLALYALALVAAAAAMRTKEIAFTLPFALGLYEIVFFGWPRWRRTAALVPFLTVSLIVPLAFVQLDRPVAQVVSQAAAASSVQTQLSRLDYLATELTIVPRYLWLLVLPFGQNVDHDPPTQHGFASWPVLGGLVLIAALLAGAIALCRRFEGERRPEGLDPAVRLVGFGVLWFFLTIAVESTVIPIIDTMVEHRLYLPSAGLFAGVATGLALLARRIAPARAGPVTAAGGLAIAVALGLATHLRNEVWSSEIALWSDAAAKSPAKPRPHYNLGLSLARAHQEADAIRELQADVALDPSHAQGYEDLGLALAGAGRAAEAEAALRQAALIAPDRPEAQLALGTFYLNAARPADALGPLARALELRPGYPQAYANAAGALNQLRRYEDTVRLMAGAPAETWANSQARFNAGVARAALGDVLAATRDADALQQSAPELAAQLRQFTASRAAAR